MSRPQPGIFDDAHLHHYHIEYQFEKADSAGGLINRAREAASEMLGNNGYVVMGLRPSLLAMLSPENSPDDCQDFKSIEGIKNFTAPATQNDIWFWLQSSSQDKNLDAALAVSKVFGDVAQLAVDVPSFVRHEKRDLTGFVDGSANPEGDDRQFAAVIPFGQPGAGGSIALTQRWVHDLPKFEKLPVGEQEAVIGRTKSDSIELEGDEMPDDSHVSRTDVKLDGTALKIYRRSTPYGTVNEHGLFFIAFACERRRLQIQLERMFGIWEDGLHDRLIEFSKPVTGSYWFVPSIEDLEKMRNQ